MTEHIADGDALLRRVADQPNLWKRDGGGIVRPTSAAMKPHGADAGLCVDVRRLLADPADPTSVLASFPRHGLAEFTAEVPRSLGLRVHHAPLEENPAHANVTGFDELTRAEAKRVQREIALKSAWVRMPATAEEG